VFGGCQPIASSSARNDEGLYIDFIIFNLTFVPFIIMKRNLSTLMVFACLLAACSKDETKSENKTPEPVAYPVELSYKGTPAVGDFNNVKRVLESNKRLTELNADIGEFYADSVIMHLADGGEISGPRDSVLVAVSGWIQSLTSLKIDVISAIPVNNADLNHEWVFVWTDEVHTYKDGKVVTQTLHEDYRMVNGKIREIYQYTRKPTASE